MPVVHSRGKFLGENGLRWLSAYHDERGWIPETEAALLRCQGCERATIVVTDSNGVGLHRYPTPGAGALDPAVDPRVASAYDEGMRCLSVGANRAAAVVSRSAVRLFIQDKGSE